MHSIESRLLQDQKIYCLQARLCIYQPRNFTGWAVKGLTKEFVCAAIELIKELMSYEVADSLLSGLVSLLRPALDDINKPQQDLLEGTNYDCRCIFF